jgi:hypothetical protein
VNGWGNPATVVEIIAKGDAGEETEGVLIHGPPLGNLVVNPYHSEWEDTTFVRRGPPLPRSQWEFFNGGGPLDPPTSEEAC